MSQRALHAVDVLPPIDPPSWDLGELVAALRTARHTRSDWRDDEAERRERPSQEALVGIVRGLRAALFPSHFGAVKIGDAGVDRYVGYTLDATLRELEEQIRRNLRHAPGRHDDSPDAIARRARVLVGRFASTLPGVRSALEQDVRAAFEGDPSARSRSEVIVCSPGIHAIVHHRLAHELYRLELFLLARVVSELAHSITGIEIHPGARIGERFFVDHGTGVVIGESAVIGDRVRLHQGVTLGAADAPSSLDEPSGAGDARHPVLEDDVVIGAGATLLGRIVVGRGSTIGGNVWLTSSVPPYSRVTQALARHEIRSEVKGRGE